VHLFHLECFSNRFLTLYFKKVQKILEKQSLFHLESFFQPLFDPILQKSPKDIKETELGTSHTLYDPL